MKIFGHPSLPSPTFTQVASTEVIHTTLPNEIIWFDSLKDKDYKLGKFCKDNQVPYAVFIHNITEILLYANLEAKYFIVNHNASQFQSILKEYLLDSLLLCVVDKEIEIEELALQGIDGIIFKTAL